MKWCDIEMVPQATGTLSQVLGYAKDAVDDKANSKIQLYASAKQRGTSKSGSKNTQRGLGSLNGRWSPA
jgi:hypothetical protein